MENRQYFSRTNEELTSNPQIIRAKIKDNSFEFKTDNGVFSKDFLDYATKLFLENVDFSSAFADVLDVGCGYGPIGIYAAKITGKPVTMIDVNPRALRLAKENTVLNNVSADVLESDCLKNVLNKRFSMVLTNPPIHAGKEVVYRIFEESYEVLLPEGELWVVIQQKHGAPSAIKKLETIFPKVEIIYKKKGFFVLKCKKIN